MALRAPLCALALLCLACRTDGDSKTDSAALAGCELLSHDHFVSCAPSKEGGPSDDCVSYYLEGDPLENRKGCVPGRFVFAHGPAGKKAAETSVSLEGSKGSGRLELVARSGALVEKGHPAGAALGALVFERGEEKELRLESKLLTAKYGDVALPFVDEP